MKKIENKELLLSYLTTAPYTDYFHGEIKEYAMIVEYEMGEYVVKPEELPAYLYLMVEGRCSVRTLLANGKTVILQTLKAPCLIGEMELLRQVPSFAVQALEPCRMLAIPLKQCGPMLLNDAVFLRVVGSELVAKERMESLKILHSFGYPLEKRLAYFILENRQGNRFCEKKVHIAESLGVSYRHVETVMKDFVKKGYLVKEKLIYTIVNEEALRGLCRELDGFPD